MERTRRRLAGFIRGITVAVVGVLVGTTWLVGKNAIGDVLTVGVGVFSLALLLLFPKVPEPVLVLAGALLGLAAYPLLGPAWVLG